MNFIAAVIIGAIMLGMWLLQLTTWDRDNWAGDAPKRLRPTLGLGWVILIGGIVYGALKYIHPPKEGFALAAWGAVSLKALVFAVAINAKTYFGPLVLGYALSSETYFIFEFHEFRPVPLISALADWVFEFAPGWASATYVWIQIIFGGAISGFVLHDT